MKQLTFILFFFITILAFGQEEKLYDKVISVSEFEEMLRSGKPIVLQNTYVKLDQTFVPHLMGTDKVPYIGKDAKYWEVRFDTDGNPKGIAPKHIENINSINIELRDCKLEWFWFKNIKDFRITAIFCDIPHHEARFVNCEFSYFDFDSPSILYQIYMESCTFKEEFFLFDVNKGSKYSSTMDIDMIGCNIKRGGTISGNFKDLNFNNNTINGKLEISNSLISDDLSFTNNKLIVDSLLYRCKNKWTQNPSYYYDEFYNPSSISILDNEIEQVVINGNEFFQQKGIKLLENLYNYQIENNIIEQLTLKDEKLNRINFNNSSIIKSFEFDSVFIENDFSAMGVEIPEYNLVFTWEELKGKLNFYLTDSTNYKAISQAELANEKLYNELITSYKKFFSVFKNKGDLKSANACYAEMKDVETRRLKYLYQTEGGIDHWLNYQLNVFLKYFAEYGTSPIKSIKISGWVILIFAFFYFFFYSDWDQINRKFLMERGDRLMSYFKSEQKLEELYSNKHKEDLFTFSQFKQNLKESKTEVPFFFMLFLKPLYWVAVVKHKFNSFLYKRVEFLQGKWSDLTASKKFVLGTFTFLSILTYGCYLVVVRSLNSLILSINTFTTLGFGDIPVVGISRYVAILEGFLGWFLLSIFSVSLISQILQN